MTNYNVGKGRPGSGDGGQLGVTEVGLVGKVSGKGKKRSGRGVERRH